MFLIVDVGGMTRQRWSGGGYKRMKSGAVVKHVTVVLRRDRERKGSDVGRILRIVTRRQEVVMLCVVCEVVPFWMNPIPSI